MPHFSTRMLYCACYSLKAKVVSYKKVHYHIFSACNSCTIEKRIFVSTSKVSSSKRQVLIKSKQNKIFVLCIAGWNRERLFASQTSKEGFFLLLLFFSSSFSGISSFFSFSSSFRGLFSRQKVDTRGRDRSLLFLTGTYHYTVMLL